MYSQFCTPFIDDINYFHPTFCESKTLKFPKDKIEDHVIIKGFCSWWCDVGTHIIEDIYFMEQIQEIYCMEQMMKIKSINYSWEQRSSMTWGMVSVSNNVHLWKNKFVNK